MQVSSTSQEVNSRLMGTNNTGKTEGSDLARRMNPPVDDAFYFVANAK